LEDDGALFATAARESAVSEEMRAFVTRGRDLSD